MALFTVGAVAVLDYDVVLVETGLPTDPTAITLTITSPSGTVTTPTPTHDGLGSYRYELALTEAGHWQYVWRSTGTAADTKDGVIPVRAVGSTVVQLDDVKARLNKTLTVDDDEIQQMIDAALAEYAEVVGPLPGTVTEYFDGGRDSVILSSSAATAVTAAAYNDGTTITVDDLTVRNGIVRWGYGTTGVFTYGTQNVAITYTVGSLPANHREAIIADVAGYFSATQRGGGAGPSFAGEGYEAPVSLNPIVLFPRIRALATPVIA